MARSPQGSQGGRSQSPRETGRQPPGPALAVRSLLPHPPAPTHLGPTWEAEARKRTGRFSQKLRGTWTLGRGRTGSQGHWAKQEGHVPDWLVTWGLRGGPANSQELSRPGWGLQPPQGFRQLIQAVVLAGSDAQAMGETREPQPTHKGTPQTPDTGASTSQGPGVGWGPQPHPLTETHPKRSQI